MHTFNVAKSSIVVGDTELTDDEYMFALRVRTLLRQRFSETFWSYVRALKITFKCNAPDETLLNLAFELFLPQLNDGLNLEFSTLLIDDAKMAEVVAVTSLSHIEDLLRMYARETQHNARELHEVARLVRK